MKRIIGILFALVSLPAVVAAQISYNTVSATVVDGNSHGYANAQLTAMLVSKQGNIISSATTPNGQPFNGSPVQGSLDSTGHFSIGLVPNTILSKPSETQWRITISAPTDPSIITNQSSWNITYTVSITGDIDLSSQLSALAQPIAYVNFKTGQSTITSTGGGSPGGNPFSIQTKNGLVFGGGLATLDLVGNLAANLNTQINVKMYGAVGNGITDDQAAINSACTAAKAFPVPAEVFFPKTPTGACYLTSALTACTNVSQTAPPVMGQASGGGGVCIQGKPGQDIFHASDPNITSGPAPPQQWKISNLYLKVDDTATPSFPHRWPGRWVQDGAMSSSVNPTVITSNKALFSCSDIGQPIRVKGAGAAGGNLDTTIASLPSCNGYQPSATLASPALTTVSNAYIYVSIHNLPVTTNIGNCAIAYDNFDGNSANWLTTGSLGNLFPKLVDVTIGTVSTHQQNSSCGLYFQGVWTPYGIRADNLNIWRTQFGIVEATVDTNPALGTAGEDVQEWYGGEIEADHPWISYNGSDNKIRFGQLGSTFGPYVGAVGAGNEGGAFQWTVNLPEFEQNTGGIGWIVKGTGHHFENTQLQGGSSAIAYLDTTGFRCYSCIVNGGITFGGSDNHVFVTSGAESVITAGIVNGGVNNLAEGSNESSPFQGRQPTRTTALNVTKTPGLVTSRTADFLLTNPFAPYYNQQDLLFFPEDYSFNTPFAIRPDTSSFSGEYVAITSTQGTSGFATFNAAGNNAIIGKNVPAGPITFYSSDKCPSITGYTFLAFAGSTQVAAKAFPCNSSSYTVNSVTADLSPYAGQILNFTWSVSGEVDNAWTSLVPQTPFVPGGSTPLQSLICSATSSTCLNAAGWVWSNGGSPTSLDAASPVGYSTLVGSGAHLTQWRGSSNLNGGALFPAVLSTISFLQSAPAVITDTLNGNQTSGATTITVSNAQAAWGSTGCLMVDQELECYSSGAATGATTYTVTRGQFGTTAQAHSSGATYISVGTGQMEVSCNSINQAVINVVFTPAWLFTSTAFPAQNCSGLVSEFQYAAMNGPTGQTYKVAAINIDPAPSTVVWGAIGGAIGNQTDLQTALNLKAPLASPNFSGIPLAPTDASCNAHTTQLTTEAYVAACGTGGMANPMTNAGDLIIGGTPVSGVAPPARLAAGPIANVLTSNGPGVAPSYQSIGTIAGLPFYNMVTQGGFDNTGATDISSALNTFIMGLGSKPGILYFPPGTYKMDSGVQLACTSSTCQGITILGAGRDSTFFQSACTNGYVWWLNSTAVSGSYWYGMNWGHFSIQDTSGNGACNSGLRVTQVANFWINNIETDNFAGKVYTTGTVTVTNGSTTVTGSGTTFTAAMVPGIIKVAGRPQWVCGFSSSTALTLCDAWQMPTASTTFSLQYNGIGLLLDGGVNFAQYCQVYNYVSLNNQIGIATVPSTSGSIGISRCKIYGGYIDGRRIADSFGTAWGQFTDTMDSQIAINNVGTCHFLDGAHDNVFRGECENDGTPTVVRTCNGGVAAQSCITGEEWTGASTTHTYGNSSDHEEIYNAGNSYMIDSSAVVNFSIISPRTASGGGTVNINNYNILGTTGCPTNSGISGIILANDCFYAQSGVTAPSAQFTGNPSFMTGTSSNTDVTGELSFSAATTAVYSWVNTYTSHPEVTLTCQFDCHTNPPWVTYTGVSTFTIHFSSAVTGSVTYNANGRN